MSETEWGAEREADIRERMDAVGTSSDPGHPGWGDVFCLLTLLDRARESAPVPPLVGLPNPEDA